MITNTKKLLTGKLSQGQRKVRKHMLMILESVLKQIDPYVLVKQSIRLQGNKLRVVGRKTMDLRKFKNICVVGGGKAGYKMALAIESVLGRRIEKGYLNVPVLPKQSRLKKIKLNKASHPMPSQAGIRGTKKIMQLADRADKNDLVIALISGGGSALMCLPTPDISLRQKIKVFSLLSKTPATIKEINTVRKHLSQIKGGQLAVKAWPATLVALYISDVVGDPLFTIASGLTVLDPTTFVQAINILKKYKVWHKCPLNIKKRLINGKKGIIPETPKANHQVFTGNKVNNYIIGNHQTAVTAAINKAKLLGYHVFELTSSLEGEARQVAKGIISLGKRIEKFSRPIKKPAMVVAGGETTVNVRGKGQGGRNQELVLAAIPGLLPNMAIACFGTDGVDGFTPMPVAGALADWQTVLKSRKMKLEVKKYLDNNDSYHFFSRLGEHIKTGPTGTNVGDLVLLVII